MFKNKFFASAVSAGAALSALVPLVANGTRLQEQINAESRFRANSFPTSQFIANINDIISIFVETEDYSVKALKELILLATLPNHTGTVSQNVTGLRNAINALTTGLEHLLSPEDYHYSSNVREYLQLTRDLSASYIQELGVENVAGIVAENFIKSVRALERSYERNDNVDLQKLYETDANMRSLDFFEFYRILQDEQKIKKPN